MTYTVQKGDTLWGIYKRNKAKGNTHSWNDYKKANPNYANGETMNVGDKVNIPQKIIPDESSKVKPKVKEKKPVEKAKEVVSKSKDEPVKNSESTACRCKILNGWWENDKDEKITLSQECSDVKMVITTLNIDDGVQVEITIYKSIYLAIDDVIGTFTTTVNKNKASKLITLIEDKVVKEDNFAEETTGNNTMIEELYFKVKITHKNGVHEKTLPMMEEKYLKVVKQAVLVSIFVEFPVHTSINQKNIDARDSNGSMDYGIRFNDALQDMGLSGHAGIAIDGEYYDYGPSGSAMESPGTPWWDLHAHPNAKYILDLNDKDADRIRKQMKLTTGSSVLGDASQGITETQVLVTKSQAKKIKAWWDDKYSNLGTYSLKPWAGQHCTSTVMESLQKAEVIGTGIMGTISYETEIADPEEFYEHFLEELKHQAGYLVNGSIPKDLTLPPPSKNALPAAGKDTIEIKVR